MRTNSEDNVISRGFSVITSFFKNLDGTADTKGLNVNTSLWGGETNRERIEVTLLLSTNLCWNSDLLGVEVDDGAQRDSKMYSILNESNVLPGERMGHVATWVYETFP